MDIGGKGEMSKMTYSGLRWWPLPSLVTLEEGKSRFRPC